MRVLVASLLCDRKGFKEPQRTSLAALQALTHPDYDILLNIQTTDPERWNEAVATGVRCDFWNVTGRLLREAHFDQDQFARLTPITLGREMCRYSAIQGNYDAILYVDSDVVVPPNSIERLLELDVPICGGLVPGRGAHSHAYYTSILVAMNGDVGQWHYGTAGFVLIRRPVFTSIAWRWGTTAGSNLLHSEDPLYAHDARQAGFGFWHILMTLRAEHLDDADNPLVDTETAQF